MAPIPRTTTRSALHLLALARPALRSPATTRPPLCRGSPIASRHFTTAPEPSFFIRFTGGPSLRGRFVRGFLCFVAGLAVGLSPAESFRRHVIQHAREMEATPTTQALDEIIEVQAAIAAGQIPADDPFTEALAELRAVEEHINSHPVVLAMRADTRLRESRPHLRLPPELCRVSLTAGTLSGAGRITVPPYAWTDTETPGREYVEVAHLGSQLCGHPGIVHGGFLATMLDEGLARACFAALPGGMGVTANLQINYRAPTMAGSYVVLRAELVKVEGRKAWVQGRIETLPEEGREPVILADATALFIAPKNAATLSKLLPAGVV